MGVDFRSGIALGWRLTREEVKAFSSDNYESLVDDGHLFLADNYSNKSDYIFGFVFETAASDMVEFTTKEITTFIEKTTPKALDLWHTYLPGLKAPNPSLILYLEVD